MIPKPSSRQQRSAPRADVVKGETLAGKFRVERIVGRGGMGVVIEATNIQLDQKVALKLLADGADDPAVVDRFSREARAAARLRSEHVARVYDVGRDTEHGPFIVMELLEGQTLADVIAGTGRVPIHRAVEYIIDACEGLAEAHAAGIIHQDVKPANLFLVTGADGRPSIKLLDFGIATMRSKEREVDAKSSHPSAGTPAYLAPEQLRGTPPTDHRADVWALGCVLYELLVGERAFRATRFTELVTKILETPPHPLPEDVVVPPPILAAIERCLEKDPTKRFASTGELGLALLPFARRRAHSAVARAVAYVKSGGLDPGLEMPSSMPPRPSDSLTDLPSSAQLRAPSVPSFSSIPEARDASTLPAPPARSRVPLLLLGVLLFGVLAGLAWRFGVSTPPDATIGVGTASAGSAATTPSTPASTAAAPTPTTSAAASSEPGTADAAAASTAARPRLPWAGGGVAHPTQPTQSARPVTAPTSTESEIRHNR